MNVSIEYRINQASIGEIAQHLFRCEADFVPPLNGRVVIGDYAIKIASKATRFEAWSGDTLVGLVAVYCNDLVNRVAHITNVSVLRQWTGQGIAARLIKQCIEHAKAVALGQICLEVAADNAPVVQLYKKVGFVVIKTNGALLTMALPIEQKERHGHPTQL